MSEVCKINVWLGLCAARLCEAACAAALAAAPPGFGFGGSGAGVATVEVPPADGAAVRAGVGRPPRAWSGSGGAPAPRRDAGRGTVG